MVFVTYISDNLNAGDVIANAEGARKVRCPISGKGKRGGVRVIYFTMNANLLCLVAIYKKTEQANISAKQIKEVH